jgi:glycosyltransferase involved in cell wall biosynthesis
VAQSVSRSSDDAGRASEATARSGTPRGPNKPARPSHIGFVMSTEVGLRTQYLNWRAALERGDMPVLPEWIVIDWWHDNGLLERLPGLPRGAKYALRSRMELREGLARARASGPLDALFVAATPVFQGQAGLRRRQPYFVTADTTPRQLHAFGDLYGKAPSRFALVEAAKDRERRAIYQGAHALFPWSHWVAASMVQDYGADPARVFVAPPGVDVETWDVPDRYDDPTRDPGHCHILFVGGDFQRKGGGLLLEWAKRTASRAWTLHLVTRDKVEAAHPSIHIYNGLSPNDPALVALYRQADLFALPTRGDCYSIAGIEAMASRLPLILGLTGGTGDVVKEGETGYLLDAGSPDALGELTDRLERLIAHPDLRRTMGEAARRDAEDRYDAHKNITRTVCRIRELL